MKHLLLTFSLLLFTSITLSASYAQDIVFKKNNDLVLTGAKISHHAGLNLLIFEQTVKGRAGSSIPDAAGQLDGAPVLGYVFPTSLSPTDVGFKKVNTSDEKQPYWVFMQFTAYALAI